MMKIKVPLVNKQEVRSLCGVGVDELFCGNEPYSWKRRYGEKNLCICGEDKIEI